MKLFQRYDLSKGYGDKTMYDPKKSKVFGIYADIYIKSRGKPNLIG